MSRTMTTPFTEAERGYLATQRLGRLATIGPDGTLQNNPVGFRYNADTGTIDLGGLNMGETRKFRNVEADGRVAFVVDDLASVSPWRVRGIEIRGRAEALREEPPASRPLAGALARDAADRTPRRSNEIIRIHPERILAWGVDPAHPGMHARTVVGGREQAGR